MRNFKDIIMEKLKVSKTSNAVQFETTLEDFIRAYFMIDKQHGLYSEVAYFSIIDGYEDDPMDGSTDNIFINTIIKYFDKSFHKFQDWICKFKSSSINVFETIIDYGSGPYSIEVKYEFDLDNKRIGLPAWFNKEHELYSNKLK